uniref:Uncharacterized protein n=1 Tax=Wuchereria bancrofti TaxID=6293 RepID=A0A1I8E9M2_WUCBA
MFIIIMNVSHFGAINPTNDDNSLRTTDSSEISLIGGEERCRK